MLFFSFLKRKKHQSVTFRRKRTKRSSQSNLNFGRLEPRQLLAGMVSAELNLIQNGDFSDASNGDRAMYDQVDVGGWQVNDEVSGQKINLVPILKDDRGLVMDLDSSADIFDSVFQDVETLQGHEYLLTFDIRERQSDLTDRESVTNDVEVRWNGESLGVFRAVEYWRTISVYVQGGSAEFSTLEFREVVDGSAGSDGNGAMIDNVQLINVSSSTITNGGFEEQGSEGESLRFDETLFPTWGAFGPDEFRGIHLVNGEAPDGSPTTTTEGEFALELDGSANNTDRVFADFATTVDAEYFLTFDMRAASDEFNIENEVRVRWNDAWAGTFHGTSDWQSFGLFVAADSDTTRVVFREPGEHLGDGQGPIIDNVKLVRIDAATEDISLDLNGEEDGEDQTVEVNVAQSLNPVVPNVDVTNLSGQNISGVRVFLTNRPNGSDEVLAVDVGSTNIDASYNAENGFLVLRGPGSAEDFETVLQSLTYGNQAADVDLTDRVLQIEMVQGELVSYQQSVTISLLNNALPRVESVEDSRADVGREFSQQITASDPEGTDITYDVTAIGQAVGIGTSQLQISDSGLLTWTPDRSGILDVTVTVTDADGFSSSTEFQLTSQIVGEVPSDFAPFSGTRQLSNVTPSLRNGIYTDAPALSIDTTASYTATIVTSNGDIELELFPEQAPLAVNNFVNLANDGYYDGLSFDRVIEGFVAQGGDPLMTTGGGPGYQFADEFDPSLRFDAAGVLAMANSGAATNGSQFFITYGPTTHLNDVHTIFGRVVSGNDAFNEITRRTPGNTAEATIMHSVTITEN